MSFRTVLEQAQGKLTQSEERIASILLNASQEALLHSAAQIAERAGVHESTVIRFAQKLGYDGYPELRRDLAADVQRTARAGARWRKAVEPYGFEVLVREQLEIIAQLPNHVSQKSVDAAAQALLSAHRIFVYGIDMSRFLVEFMARKLRRMGLEVVALEFGGSDLAERLVGFGSTDVLLAFGFASQRDHTVRLLRLAHAAGGTTILITDLSGILLEPSPSILLAAPRGAETRQPLVVPLIICYSLEYSLGHLAPERLATAIERADDLQRILGKDSRQPSRQTLFEAETPEPNGDRTAYEMPGTDDVAPDSQRPD